MPEDFRKTGHMQIARRLAILLVLAWKVAGYYGLDYYLLPLLGTPWRRGQAFERRAEPASA